MTPIAKVWSNSGGGLGETLVEHHVAAVSPPRYVSALSSRGNVSIRKRERTDRLAAICNEALIAGVRPAQIGDDGPPASGHLEGKASHLPGGQFPLDRPRWNVDHVEVCVILPEHLGRLLLARRDYGVVSVVAPVPSPDVTERVPLEYEWLYGRLGHS